MIVSGDNTFRAEGEREEAGGILNQYCLSEDLSSGAVTFLFRSFVEYGDVYRYSEGCKFNVTFEDGTELEVYVGDSDVPCYEKEDDAIADSLNRLAKQLDWDGNGLVDVKFTADQLAVESVVQSRVQSMWGPAIFRLVIWI